MLGHSVIQKGVWIEDELGSFRVRGERWDVSSETDAGGGGGRGEV